MGTDSIIYQTVNSSISSVRKKTIPDSQEHHDEMSDVRLYNEQMLNETNSSEQLENKNEKDDKEKNDKENKKS